MTTIRKPQTLLSEEETNDNALLAMLIDLYANLQRIKTAEDKGKEIDYQIRITKATLASCGVITEKPDTV